MDTEKPRKTRPLHFAPAFVWRTSCGKGLSRVRSTHMLQRWATALMKDERVCPACVKVVAEQTNAPSAKEPTP